MIVFRSPTHGVCENIEQVIDIMFEKITSKEHADWTIAIGTDSQNKKSTTKFCSAILLLEKGKGGIYFYTLNSEERFHVLQNRMLREAELSIVLGREVITKAEDKILEDGLLDRNISVSFEIHCDLGEYGKSQESIKAAIGWITSEFGDSVVARVKPESTAASSIADKHTR